MFIFNRNTALIPAPVPRDRLANWLAQHQANLDAARKGGVDVLFLGDSITAGWVTGSGSNLWAADFAPRHVANFGIGGDRIQHVLWRVENGELADLDPKVVVLLIGTNNCGKEEDGRPRNTVPEIIEGTANLVRQIEYRLPRTKIMLFGIFPRDGKLNPIRQQIMAVNAGLAKLGNDKVKFIDLWEKFLAPDGKLPRALFPDLLHPSSSGYQIWAEAINDALNPGPNSGRARLNVCGQTHSCQFAFQAYDLLRF